MLLLKIESKSSELIPAVKETPFLHEHPNPTDRVILIKFEEIIAKRDTRFNTYFLTTIVFLCGGGWILDGSDYRHDTSLSLESLTWLISIGKQVITVQLRRLLFPARDFPEPMRPM